MPLLDTVVPEYEAWERHSVALPVAPARALRVPRGLVEELATTPPFREVGRSETEFVAGPSPRRLEAMARAAA